MKNKSYDANPDSYNPKALIGIYGIVGIFLIVGVYLGMTGQLKTQAQLDAQQCAQYTRALDGNMVCAEYVAK